MILAAGAIGSPQILQLSGIGNGKNLAELGIELKVDLLVVGDNLHDHLQLRSIYSVENTETLNHKFNSLVGKLSMGLEYLFFKTGPLLCLLHNLGHSQKVITLDQMLISNGMFNHCHWIIWLPLHKFDGITPAVCNLQPTSRGSVKVTSPCPTDYQK